MEWFLIVIVVMFVMAPVMWLKPSPRQQRQASLRSSVRKQGVEVKMAVPPLHYVKQVMPGYQWRYPQQAPGPDFLLVRDSDASDSLTPYHAGWRWRIAPLRAWPEPADSVLKALLERLPQDALVLESSESSLTLWWWESQNAERFSSYIEDFVTLRDCLKGHADRPKKQPTAAVLNQDTDDVSAS
ncbi:MAG: preprotein translocase subunit YajC [Halomonas sp.]|jgi:hypothetical protein|nr:preprotein translocase subunit YajC [Halomonas sp.]TVM05150.1 MAG: preprotein translocase subunit YajC [Halomonas sp.]